ncbi:MAG: RecQ family ATP-dependent DNA helicase [Tannerella sp.]|nr:RecQ family ATP-dependent DNA helicase [Tannerella sp.]
MADILNETLEKYWGYKSFRPLQEDIIRSVLAGNDTLGLMPTGGGKSLTFQVPTMTLEGLCIVVTPLIALMKDQVDNLRSRGIKATTVYSGMTGDEINKHLDNCIYGDYKFLYISPERIHTELFKRKLSAMNVCMLVVDESHCISQWGYDFRPSYLHIAEIRQMLPESIPALALTATATPDVVDDIQDKLLFHKKNVLKKSFVRDNLAYIVRNTENKMDELINILKRIDGTAIVYVRNRKNTQEIARTLQQEGFSANFFHAGLNREEKSQRQDAWKNGTCRIIVATNAFGMGIDKPDVRLVIHIDMPGSLEEYFQEAGRAGRDEKKSYAVALCSSTESSKLKKRISDEYPDKKIIIRIYEALGNYFQVAIGFGAFLTHDFSIQNFCKNFKFSTVQVHNALKILKDAGYLEYVEEPDNNSRILFLTHRDELYRMKFDKLSDNVIQVILRSYTGIFADYVFIDESLIATRINSSHDDVYNALIMLSKSHVINYIPRKKMPQVVFTCNREETNRVVIPRSIYEDRFERTQRRIKEVLAYINDQRHCRTRILLHYFGEKADKDCKVCDVCLRKTQSGLTNWELNAVKDQLMQQLNEKKSLPVNFLALELPLGKEKNLKALRYLIDNEENLQYKDGVISLGNAK